MPLDRKKRSISLAHVGGFLLSSSHSNPDSQYAKISLQSRSFCCSSYIILVSLVSAVVSSMLGETAVTDAIGIRERQSAFSCTLPGRYRIVYFTFANRIAQRPSRPVSSFRDCSHCNGRWSLIMTNGSSCRYCRNLFIASTTAKASFSIVENLTSLSLRCLL